MATSADDEADTPPQHPGFRGSLAVVGDPAADHLVNDDPSALLVAMLLDQQIPLGWAFAGPLRLQRRLGTIDLADIARLSPDDVVAAAVQKPAVHRFPAVMGRRIHELATVVVDEYGGDPVAIWSGAPDAADVVDRLRALPGFGDEKAQITMAVLAKRFGITPDGWRDAAGPFGDDQPRSAADIHDDASRAAVKAWKQAQRHKGLDKQDRPLPRDSAANPAANRADDPAGKTGRTHGSAG